MQECEETAQALVEKLKARSMTVAVAESCTAGLVSAMLANTPGASGVMWGSFVCYTKEAKIAMLDIEPQTLEESGLVSRETALAMASGALKKSGADLAAAVTGLAGPGGDGSGAEVGTVWAAAGRKNGEITAKEYRFTGDRNTVRLKAAAAVIEMLTSLLT